MFGMLPAFHTAQRALLNKTNPVHMLLFLFDRCIWNHLIIKKGCDLEPCRDGRTLWERVKILDCFCQKDPQLKVLKSQMEVQASRSYMFSLGTSVCQLPGVTYSRLFKNTFCLLIFIYVTFILMQTLLWQHDLGTVINTAITHFTGSAMAQTELT